MNWQSVLSDHLVDAGLTRGIRHPSVFHHPAKDIWTLVHGDDYCSAGSPSSLDWMDDLLAKRYEIKTQDCECYPTHGAQLEAEDHNGHECFDHPNEACFVRENVDVWCFTDQGEADGKYAEATEADVAHEIALMEREGKTLLVYRPAELRLEAPGQIGADL